MDKIDQIIIKIEGLLKLSYDSPDDEECQTALLLAQKLMAKYNVPINKVKSKKNTEDDIGGVIAYSSPRIAWWKMQVAAILCKNFRCKAIRRRILKSETKIIFYGYDNDTEICFRGYNATIAYLEHRLNQIRKNRLGTDYKNSYLNGFLYGLDERFDEQRETLEEKYELTLLVPVEVLNKLEVKEGKLRTLNVDEPTYNMDYQAYMTGYEHGKSSKVMPEDLIEENRED